MTVRRLSAHYVFTGCSAPLKRGIIELNEQGQILKVIDTKGMLEESANLEFYEGVLIPGFVNAHAHLELSHLKNKIPKHTGLIGFIGSIGKLRSLQPDVQLIANADKEMQCNGIVAVGDISNGANSFYQKTKSNIQYLTFIELMGMAEAISQTRFEDGIELLKILRKAGLKGFLTPHAPYSLSSSLWRMLTADANSHPVIWSVHNQESAEETNLFRDGSGGFPPFLSLFGNDFLKWSGKAKSSLQYALQYYSSVSKLLLVHNTFTADEDLRMLKIAGVNTTLVLCPNANLYIENTLPDIPMLASSGLPIALGTDSLASNSRLSVLEEMKTIQLRFSDISLEQLVNWGTLSGAQALGFDSELGSFEPGKKPGVNLITGVDIAALRLTENSQVEVLQHP
jgi:cytosine/adenosine deaminase-related metal-dependent hydrolase